MLNLKLSSASCDKIQRAGNQVKVSGAAAKGSHIRHGGPFLDAI